MDLVIPDPPDSYMTDRYMFCEWAERVMCEVEKINAPQVAMAQPAIMKLMARLRAHTVCNPASAAALVLGLDEMDAAITAADVFDSTIVLPSAPFINLAHRVMEYARH